VFAVEELKKVQLISTQKASKLRWKIILWASQTRVYLSIN
jgi:hypothetical protein